MHEGGASEGVSRLRAVPKIMPGVHRAPSIATKTFGALRSHGSSSDARASNSAPVAGSGGLRRCPITGLFEATRRRIGRKRGPRPRQQHKNRVVPNSRAPLTKKLVHGRTHAALPWVRAWNH